MQLGKRVSKQVLHYFEYVSWLLVHCSFSPVCQQSSSGSDSDEDQDMQAESESESDAPPSSDELPNEDDVKFWETPSGHDIYLSTPLSPATETTRGDALVMSHYPFACLHVLQKEVLSGFNNILTK